jgi:type IV pilus assembly protein PilB
MVPQAQSRYLSLLPAPHDVRLLVEAPEPAMGRGRRRKRLGQLLVEQGRITADQLASALSAAEDAGEKLGQILVRHGLLTEPDLVDCLSSQLSIPSLAVPGDPIDPDVLRLIPTSIARKYDVLPIRRTNGCLTVAMADPTNLRALDDMTFATSLRIVPVIAPQSMIRRAIESLYESSATADALDTGIEESEVQIVDQLSGRADDLADLKSWADRPPVIRLVNMIFTEAIRQAASDIHLEPADSGLYVRFRLDGLLQRVKTLPKRLEAGVVSRIKIMANLDIAERRLPQDGRLKIQFEGREIDVRVSSMPTVCGESLCMRLLDRQTVRLSLSGLGFEPSSLQAFTNAIDAKDGMILITGPTGSGKTTTLYSGIERLRPREMKIMTVEDPVEYHLDGVIQVAVQDEIGRSFAVVLRTFLRHDPDVLLVGEMRDPETAQIGIRAALTGHLVLTTLHAIDCPAAIPRMLDMGITPSLLASCLRLTVAQRLVRRLCVHCREPYEADEADLVSYGHRLTGVGRCTLYRPRGCSRCRFTGMRGRVAIYEIMQTSAEVARLITRNAPGSEIREAARRHGMVTLREAGLRKVLEGITTPSEVMRATLGEATGE